MFGEGEFSQEFVVLDKGRLLVQKRFVELLGRAGLHSFKDFMSIEHGKVLGQRSNRVRMRIELDDPEGRQVFYLKRHHRPRLLDRLAKGLRIGPAVSPGRQELMNVLHLEKAELATMSVAAAGEAQADDGSFIMVAELDGYEALNDFLKVFLADSDRPGFWQEKCELIRALGTYVRKLHAAGMDHRDLYLVHLFVRPENPAGSLSLIDLQRVSKRRRVRWWGRIKDLAALNYSGGQVGISRTDRLRFALEYFQTGRLNRGQRQLLRLVKFKTGRIRRHDRKLQAKYSGQGY